MRVCDLTMDGVLDSYREPDDAYKKKIKKKKKKRERERESQMTKNIGEADPYSQIYFFNRYKQ